MIEELIALFNQGNLQDAIKQANAGVSDQPRDLPLRLVLVQLVCFTRNWDRVEKIAKQLKALDTAGEHLPLTGLIDNLSIAEIQRNAVWNDGMVPEFVNKPDEITNQMLWAWNCLRSGEYAKYHETLDKVLQGTPLLSLNLDGKTYEGFRDLDDPTSTIFEAYTVQGNYLWIPFHIVKKIDVAKPVRLIDHLWNKTRLTLQDGTDLAVFIPGTYFPSKKAQLTDALLLGRETVYQDIDSVELGLGRRIFGAGEEEFSLFDLRNATLEVVS